jgi:hypothetical protein
LGLTTSRHIAVVELGTNVQQANINDNGGFLRVDPKVWVDALAVQRGVHILDLQRLEVQ